MNILFSTYLKSGNELIEPIDSTFAINELKSVFKRSLKSVTPFVVAKRVSVERL